MAKPRKKLPDYLVYLAVRLVAMFVHMLPVELVYRLAGWVGELWYRFDARHRRRVIDNLRASFPDWTGQKLEDVAAGAFRSIAYLAIEVLLTTRLITHWTWSRHIRLPDQGPLIRMLLARRSGIVMVSAHLGGWETVGYTLAALGFEGYAVARPLDNPYLNDYLLGAREKMGMRILDKRGAMEAMDDIFRAKDYVGFIADQDAGPTGLFVDFMGRAASTYKAPALMAMRYNVPLAVGYGRRVGERYLFKLGVERVILPHEWAERDDPLRWITQEYTAAIERVVRAWPEQYLWIYRRWKTQPRKARLAGVAAS